MELQTKWIIGGSIVVLVASYFAYEYGLKQGQVVALTGSGKGGAGSGSGKGGSGTNTTPPKDTIDAIFNLAFSKIKLMPFYQQSGATEKFLIDNAMVFISSNQQVKQNIKAYADANHIPIEDAIVMQLIPKK